MCGDPELRHTRDPAVAIRLPGSERLSFLHLSVTTVEPLFYVLNVNLKVILDVIHETLEVLESDFILSLEDRLVKAFSVAP